MLPCTDLKSRHPSRKEILENAISHIMQLQEDIREAYLQKGLKTEDLKAILQDSDELSFSHNGASVTDHQSDADLISEETSSLPSPPELTIDENAPSRSASPNSELSGYESVEMLNSQESAEMFSSQETTGMFSSQGSVEMEEISAKTLQDGNTETQVNHVKRPMNAFLLYSQQYRKAFKVLYPGRDNREISTILAKHWRSMKPEQKEPYKEKARELMRITRESHPDFKYCEARKEMGIAVAESNGDKQVGHDQGYR